MFVNSDYSHNLFESIITYAVDQNGHQGDVSSSLLGEIGLNDSVFYEKLYVSRPKQEEIYKCIQTSFQPILVYGFPGTGKTTIVRKVLHTLEKEKNALIIQFDLKGLDNIPSFPPDFDIEKWHKDKLFARLTSILYQLKIDDFQVLKFFFEDKNASYQMGADFERLRRPLYNEYKLSEDKLCFSDWFKSKLDSSRSEIYDIAKHLNSSIRNRDYLFFLANYDIDNIRQIVLFYDNLDNVTSNDVRKAFYRFIREYSGVLNRFAHVIITSRVSSIADQNLSDYGTRDWQRVQIDYQEFINQGALEKRICEMNLSKGYCNPDDKLMIMRNLEYSAREQFAKKIVQKRTHFLEESLNNKSIRERVDERHLDYIKELYDLILNSPNIHGDLLDLSNHDRHWMLRFLVFFIRYIMQDLKLIPNDLGESISERSFILESYFYHWTIENDKISCNILDLVNDTQEWITDKTNPGISIRQLIINLIYNLTERQRGQNDYTSKTNIGDVVEKMKILGYRPDQIQKSLFEMLKKDDQYLGLIETSKFFAIEMASDLTPDVSVWLTPRSAFICEYLSVKFLYMITLYKRNKIQGFNGKTFDYQDKLPLSIENISTNLDFLCKVAAAHYHAMCDISSKLGGNVEITDWYKYFRRYYCVKTHGTKRNDDQGDLQFNNLLRGHIKFLEHQGSIPTYEYITTQIVNQYNRLGKAFSKSISDLRNGIMVDDLSYNYLYIHFKKSINWDVLLQTPKTKQ